MSQTTTTAENVTKPVQDARQTTIPPRRAWTGGDGPRALGTLGIERRTVSEFFREQVTIWRDFWHDMPDRDTLRIFWNRARHDAHATHRPRSTWETSNE